MLCRTLPTLFFVQEHKVCTGLRTNLQESWLNGSDLSQARLEKVVLVRVPLREVDFNGAQLHGAITRQLCLMNMFLHNVGEIDDGAPISPNDSLVADAGPRFDYVLANPPFGKKSSMSFTNEEGEQETDDLTYNRQDFWATTSNKQLNFV